MQDNTHRCSQLHCLAMTLLSTEHPTGQWNCSLLPIVGSTIQLIGDFFLVT